MKNLFKVFGIIVIVAIIGFSMAACSSGDNGTITTNPDDGTKTNPDDGTKTNPDDGKTSPDDKTPITVAEISITAPVNGGIPATSVDGEEDERFTAGTVTWSPNDNPFKPNTEYTATVTLTAKSGLTFTGLNADQPTVNGTAVTILSNTGATVTLSHKFPATSTKIVTNIAIKSTPNKTSYTHGEKLDLTGMAVTLTYNDGASEDVAAVNFAAKGITAIPAEGTHLVHTTHNNKPITIEHGSLTPLTTGNLTVAVVDVNDLTIEPNPIPAATYTGSDIEPAITVKHPVVDSTRTLEKGVDYTVSYSNNTNAGTAKITITGKGDYTGDKVINFTINKASGATVSAPIQNSNYLEYVNGATDWNIINAVTPPINGQSVEYGMSTKTNNAATVTAWQDGLNFSVSPYGLIDYFFIFARSKEDENHFAGAASAGLSVVTYTGLQSHYSISFGGLPDNTAATPYTFKVKVDVWPNNSSIEGFDKFPERDPYKYFSLDISESTLTYIQSIGFQNCTTLVSVILPNSVTEIRSQAFQGCTSLTSVTLGNGLTTIGNDAFYGCTSLTSVTIPNNVTTIGQWAFRGCTSLTSVTIGSSVASIGTWAFYSCSSLTSVRFERAGTTFPTTSATGPFPSFSSASLQTAYSEGGIGTYTREGSTWTKISD
jgi:hypothetical protein